MSYRFVSKEIRGGWAIFKVDSELDSRDPKAKKVAEVYDKSTLELLLNAPAVLQMSLIYNANNPAMVHQGRDYSKLKDSFGESFMKILRSFK